MNIKEKVLLKVLSHLLYNLLSSSCGQAFFSLRFIFSPYPFYMFMFLTILSFSLFSERKSIFASLETHYRYLYDI